MTYRKAVIIYNPFAGAFKRKRREHWLHSSVELLQETGCDVAAIPTTGPETAAGIARQCVEDRADLVLAAGGDGTINEVMNGMVGSDVPLGILPAGTANVLAMELGIGAHMVTVARRIKDYVPERISVGRIRFGPARQERFFLLMAGVGLDAEIVYGLSPARKLAFGKVAYWLAGLSKLGQRIPEFSVSLLGQNMRAGFALASRVRNYGGDLEIAPSISLLDADLELVLFSGESSVTYLKYMLGIALGRVQTTRGIQVVRTRELSCTSPEDTRIHVQVDGEYAGQLPVEIDVIPQALTLLIPEDFRKRRPASEAESAWTTSHTR